MGSLLLLSSVISLDILSKLSFVAFIAINDFLSAALYATRFTFTIFYIASESNLLFFSVIGVVGVASVGVS